MSDSCHRIGMLSSDDEKHSNSGGPAYTIESGLTACGKVSAGEAFVAFTSELRDRTSKLCLK